MTSRKILKLIHFGGICWFGIAAVFLLLVALRQVGVQWWVIFSFSGYSAVLFVFLLNIYIFAFFQGVVRSKLAPEHPLTTSLPYMAFYDLCPFLGALAGLITAVSIVEMSWIGKFSIIAEGTLGLTFLVWIAIDPLLGVAEGFIPECAQLRMQRLAEAAHVRQRQEQENQTLLENLKLRDSENKQLWGQTLGQRAEQLACAISNGTAASLAAIEKQAVELGAEAWRMGGVICMRFIHRKIKQHLKTGTMDYPAFWWDGIGTWKRPSPDKIVFTEG